VQLGDFQVKARCGAAGGARDAMRHLERLAPREARSPLKWLKLPKPHAVIWCPGKPRQPGCLKPRHLEDASRAYSVMAQVVRSNEASDEEVAVGCSQCWRLSVSGLPGRLSRLFQILRRRKRLSRKGSLESLVGLAAPAAAAAEAISSPRIPGHSSWCDRAGGND